MGTYLDLELKDKSVEGINKVNDIWNKENVGYEDTLHFRTEKETEEDIKYIHKDPKQNHLRYIKTVEDWNKSFPVWSVGKFQVKITMGDYLCSEMARRYLQFIRKHKDLFCEYPDSYVVGILENMSKEEHKAEDCIVECKYCKG